VLGKSGTGKSVLLKNIVGLLTPDSGRIWLDGTEVTGISESRLYEVRRRCAMVFQNPALLDSMSVYENVAFALGSKLSQGEQQEKVHSALKLVGLEADIETKLPAELSFGYLKRVSIARSLALQPSHLLFDEPTTGLDPISTTAIHSLIFDLAQKLGVTALVVSHDMRSALKVAHRLVVLESGKIVADCRPEEIKNSPLAIIQEFLEHSGLGE